MKYALFSCYYKQGILEFAKSLEKLGYTIISTGGTLKELNEGGVKGIDVSEVTGSPHMLGGRVKTLHPKIHGGILYRRENTSDVKEILEYGINPIDIVVNNLYPFKATWLDNKGHDDIIEKIDIGGPSMIRACAKNYKYTNIIVDNDDFDRVLSELEKDGKTTLETRTYLAKKAFQLTAEYDSFIAKYFDKITDDKFPDKMTLALSNKKELRYGENPQQKAYSYELFSGLNKSFSNYKVHQGKELSFNNYNDAYAAISMVRLFRDMPTAVAVKHTNPCGIASGKTIYEAYKKAYSCDSESIFGGIVAFNGEVDEKTASEMVKIFLEVIIAPSYTKEALEVFKQKENLRVLEYSDLMNSEDGYDIKVLGGTVLVQEKDEKEDEKFEVVTKRKPTEAEIQDAKFALKAVKFAKSNAVVLVKDMMTIGIGLGNVNRFFAVEAALKQAKGNTEGAVLASDGFFPFDDSVRLLAKYGVKTIVEPGGSIKDSKSIEACDELDVSLVMTGSRHFKH